MRERNFGRIFNITSVYGLRGTPERVGYVTTKAALLGLTRSVALENLEYDITCHSICPGSVLTPAWGRRLAADPALVDRLLPHYPLGRLVTPEDVANAVLLLASPLAAGITGVTLPVDAGLTAGNLRFVRDVVGG